MLRPAWLLLWVYAGPRVGAARLRLPLAAPGDLAGTVPGEAGSVPTSAHSSAHALLLLSLQLAGGVNSGQGLGIEIIATLQLVLCVLATTDRRRRDLGGSAPLAIGFSVALGHLLAVSGEPRWEGTGSRAPLGQGPTGGEGLWA